MASIPPCFRPALLILVSILCSNRAKAQIFTDFETTGGNFTIEMFYEDQPMTVASFIGLADGSITWIDLTSLELQRDHPFFDGIKFHRVIKDFMIQGGSPNGRGTDNPGYQFVDRFARDIDGTLIHPHDQQGLISMANSGINTNGSQFFITDVPTPWLDDKHVVFGKIAAGPFGTLEQGLATITAMNDTPVTGSTPNEDLIISKITVRRVGDEAAAFDVHAQGLPILSDPAARLIIDESAENGDKAELHYAKPQLNKVDALSSDNLRNWTTLTSEFYGETSNSPDDVSEIFNDKSAQFFRLLQFDYSKSPHAGGPGTLSSGSLKLEFDAIFNIDLTLDASGTDGTWDRPDGGGNGPLETVAYTPKSAPYVDRLVVRYDGLVPNSDFVFQMDFSLSFDTPTSGRFSGTTNGSPQSVSGTFEWVQ